MAVLGNSHFHLSIFREFMEWGGPCIAHDARMLNFYWELLGEARTLEAAKAELGRTVTAAEVRQWLADQADLPALFLEDVTAAAAPLFVHSAGTARLLEGKGIASVPLPFSPYRVLSDEALSPAARAAARRATRIPERRMLVVTFGAVMADRAILDIMWAVEMLRSWGYDAVLACIGGVAPAMANYLKNMSATLGIADHVLLTPQGVSDRHYRQWLQAADFAVQLRTYGMGGLSGALLDCMAAGLPSIANAHLAASMAAPEWVQRIPDGISAILIAERLAELHSAGAHRTRHLEGRRALLAERGFGTYARRLLEGLGLEAAEQAG